MALEKRLEAVPSQSFTANGTNDGMITVADATEYKVKQLVFLTATSLPDLDTIEVKRVVDATHLFVGPRGGSIDARTNISAYTVALSAAIVANEQNRPNIPNESINRAVYEEEPTLAHRVFPVDELGNDYTPDNPFPTVSEGSAADQPWDDLLLARDPVTQDLTVATYKKNGNVVRTLTFTYDANENLVEVKKS